LVNRRQGYRAANKALADIRISITVLRGRSTMAQAASTGRRPLTRFTMTPCADS
jgi:hypothetical protein